MRRRFLAFPVAIVLAACGGSTTGPDAHEETTPPPAPPMIGPQPPSTRGNDLEGSYDLLLMNGGLPGKPSDAARVDIRGGPSGWEAILTPRWGEPSLLKVGVASTIFMSGQATYQATDGRRIFDTFTSIVVDDPGPSFRPFGPVDANGTSEDDSSDVSTSTPIWAHGTIDVDTTPPDMRIDAMSALGPPDRLLPWDTIGARAAEPVDLASKPLVIVDSAGNAVDAAWSVEALSGEVSHAGAVLAHGTLKSWTELGGLALSWGPYVDAVGLQGQGRLALPIADIGPAVAGQPFDGEAVHVATWGTVTPATSSDPRCAGATGGCMVLGPFQDWACADRIGFAGRLATAGKSRVSVRYRVLAADDPRGASLPPVAVDVAVPGSPSTPTFDTTTRAFTPLPSPIGSLTRGSDWSIVTIPVPAGANEVGYDVRPDSSEYAGKGYPCGQLAPGVAAAIVVDAVTVE